MCVDTLSVWLHQSHKMLIRTSHLAASTCKRFISSGWHSNNSAKKMRLDFGGSNNTTSNNPNPYLAVLMLVLEGGICWVAVTLALATA